MIGVMILVVIFIIGVGIHRCTNYTKTGHHMDGLYSVSSYRKTSSLSSAEKEYYEKKNSTHLRNTVIFAVVLYGTIALIMYSH